MGGLSLIKIMEKLGYRHVPDNMVQVIERNGRYHRAEDQTFVKHRAFIESFGPQVRVGVRVIDHLYENLASRDGVLHKISVGVKIFFDLRQADPTIAPLLARDCEAILYNKVKGLVDLALRRELAYLDAAKLLLPGTAIQLEEAIKKRLIQPLEFMGASILSTEDGLNVKEILPPPRLQETRTEATNIAETTHSLARLTDEEIRQALIAHLFRDLGHTGLQAKAVNLPDGLNPTSDAGRDPAVRVLRQPTGRVYDN